jgi:predicted DCC family thiol-disulfide oxidoreductase YuxK
MTDTHNTIYIVYDDQCPFCRNYCQLLRLRETAGNVVLIDARLPSPLINDITAKGLDIDHGMVVKIGKDLHYGAGAIHILALLSSQSNLFNRVTYWIFKSQKRSSILYPALKNCRNLALKIMGIPLINNLQSPLQKSGPATQ